MVGRILKFLLVRLKTFKNKSIEIEYSHPNES